MSAHLIDYAATKGAIVAFTRSLSLLALVENGIYVSVAAPRSDLDPAHSRKLQRERKWRGKAPAGK